MYFGMMFYYGLSMNSLADILKQAMWVAKDEFQCDSFNIMCILGYTEELMKEQGFLAADGCSHFYLINWSLGDN